MLFRIGEFFLFNNCSGLLFLFVFPENISLITIKLCVNGFDVKIYLVT